jgi:hypothetical protein
MSSGRTFAVLWVAGLLGVGCRPPPPAPPLEELRSAPLSQSFDSGSVVALYAHLWRDFMPPSPSDGKPMIGTFEVSALTSASLPPELSVDAAFVVFGDQVWASWPEPDGSCDARFCIRRTSRDGPRWGPDVEVDVVVQITSGSNPSVLLRDPGVMITRTE